MVLRLALDPLAAHYTSKALDDLEGYAGSFRDVHVGLFPLSYSITDLKLVEEPARDWREPVVYAERLQAHVSLRDLLRLRVAARVRVDDPKVIFDYGRQRTAKEVAEAVDRPPIDLNTLDERLRAIVPARIDRLEVKDGEVLYVDRTIAGSPRLWLHHLEMTIENLATRDALAGGRPLTVALRSRVQRSGVLTTFVSADPLSETLAFAGRAELRGLALKDLYAFISATSGLSIPKGTFDCLVEFTAGGDRIDGSVRPLLRNVEIEAADDSFVNSIKGAFADATLDLFSGDGRGRDAVATTIPMRGKLTTPDAQLAPTLLGVLRNAFVEGLSASFRDMPLDTAAKDEGLFTKARKALSGEGEVEAEPVSEEEAREQEREEKKEDVEEEREEERSAPRATR